MKKSLLLAGAVCVTALSNSAFAHENDNQAPHAAGQLWQRSLEMVSLL